MKKRQQSEERDRINDITYIRMELDMRISFIFYLFLLLPISASGACGDNYYWEIDVPVLEGGSNVVADKSEAFSTITKCYDIRIESIETVAEFYDEFFMSIGWKNPFKKAMSIDKELKTSWSAHRMSFNEAGKPEAIYANTWKAKELPAKGLLQLTLSNYDGKYFEGHIKLVISPDINMSPLLEINKLIGRDPKNLFHLYKAVKGNPFKIETITIPSSINNNDSLVKAYYGLVKQMMSSYSDFHKKYVNGEMGTSLD